jgi:hypothetical protein
MAELETADRFEIRQLIRPVANLYHVSVLDDGGQPGTRVAFVRQKRLKIREDIRFYADESETSELFAIKARSVFEFAGVHDVVDVDGTSIGVLEKQFGRSLVRSTWDVKDAAGRTVLTAQERSLPMAILRRVWGLIPFVGDFPYLIPFHFDFLAGGTRVGSADRPIGIGDRYILDLSGLPPETFDRRLAVAFGVALDALQDR